MSANLLCITPIDVIIDSIRTCYLTNDASDSGYKDDDLGCMPSISYQVGPKDQARISQILASGHESTIEHSLISFKVQCTRGCLQELARHRIGTSFSIQSTRYTLKKILEQCKTPSDVNKYLYQTKSELLNKLNAAHLFALKEVCAIDELENDTLKYGICEALLIEGNISFNFRSFRHFLKLRLDKRAHYEIRQLAQDMYDCIPKSHLLLLEGI